VIGLDESTIHCTI
jgi:hypothetical protein